MKILSIIIISTFLYSCGEAQTTEHIVSSNKSSEQSATIAKNVNVSEFKELIEKGPGIIVDVRTPGEYTRGNIKGSKNINIAGNFSEEIKKLDKNKPVYVYCASGGRSSRAMQTMNQMGFKEVYNLSGGFSAWSRQ
jgi:rhodanese-related sulfurtransferase